MKGTIIRIAVLDDYLGVSLSLADWGAIPGVEQLTVFEEPISEPDALIDALGGFDVIAIMRERTPFPATVLERLPDLRLLVTTGMYNSSVDIDAATVNGVLVCGTPGLRTPTPELTWGLLLALTRAIPRQDRSLREGRWQTDLGEGLDGKRLGILGLGKIGAQIAAFGQVFGMDIVAWSANLTAERAAEVGVQLVSKEELLRTADIVTIHLRLGERTRGLLAEADFRLMKPSACLINTSRGPIIDEAALVSALRSREIAGAALDVFDAEPIPKDHPLLSLDNVVLTPHIGYVTRENFEVFYGGTVEAIAAYGSGKPIRVLNPVAES